MCFVAEIRMINSVGKQSRQVIASLLSVGFTAEELTEDFCFPAGDVESVMCSTRLEGHY